MTRNKKYVWGIIGSAAVLTVAGMFLVNSPSSVPPTSTTTTELEPQTVLSVEPMSDANVGFGVSLHVIEKPSNFSTLPNYMKEEQREIEEMAEQGEPVYPCREQNIQAIKIEGYPAFLKECWINRRYEATIYIETSDYIYHIYGPGADSQEPESPQERQFVQTLIETWTFSEEVQ